MNTPSWHPGTLLAISGNYWQACTLHAAVKLDLFSALNQEALTAEQMANKLNADLRGLRMLLNALVAMDLLIKKDNRFYTDQAARNFLDRSSPQYIGHMILHHHHLVPSWSQLDQAVQTGKKLRPPVTVSDEQRREAFLMGMYNLASQQAPQIASQIDLARRRRLLDLGGGPGTYAIHFCKQYRKLKAVVFDLPSTQPFAEETIHRHDLSDRIQFLEGDYLTDDIEGCYDVIWISHILHAESPATCEKLIEKAVAALEPGGALLIHDFILNDSMDGPPFGALFALNMLLGTSEGQSYSEKQIGEMMQKAGVIQIQRLAYRGPTDSGIMSGLV